MLLRKVEKQLLKQGNNSPCVPHTAGSGGLMEAQEECRALVGGACKARSGNLCEGQGRHGNTVSLPFLFLIC